MDKPSNCSCCQVGVLVMVLSTGVMACLVCDRVDVWPRKPLESK